MSEASAVHAAFEEVEQNLEVIETCTREIERILDEAGALELLSELREAQKNHELYVTKLKHAVGESGHDQITVGAYQITVAHPKSDVVKDPKAFVATARRHGDFDHLVEAGVLAYDIDAKQIARLDPARAARYREFVSQKELAMRITIPAALKGPAAGV